MIKKQIFHILLPLWKKQIQNQPYEKILTRIQPSEKKRIGIQQIERKKDSGMNPA